MRTKKRSIYMGIMFWILVFMWTINQDGASFKLSSGVNHPNWLIAIWIVGMWTAIKSLFCIDRPAGATKHRKSHYIAYKTVDDVRMKNDIKKQSRKAKWILVLWIMFLAVEGLSYYSHIIDEKTIIVGMIGLRIFDKLFILVWCPFGAIIMGNKCCTTCRIYGWDQLMLNSPLVFIPSVPSYTLILISMIYFVDWEISVKRHPERFSQISNTAIRCYNCCEICGRCRSKNKELWFSQLFFVYEKFHKNCNIFHNKFI